MLVNFDQLFSKTILRNSIIHASRVTCLSNQLQSDHNTVKKQVKYVLLQKWIKIKDNVIIFSLFFSSTDKFNLDYAFPASISMLNLIFFR